MTISDLSNQCIYYFSPLAQVWNRELTFFSEETPLVSIAWLDSKSYSRAEKDEIIRMVGNAQAISEVARASKETQMSWLRLYNQYCLTESEINKCNHLNEQLSCLIQGNQFQILVNGPSIFPGNRDLMIKILDAVPLSKTINN